MVVERNHRDHNSRITYMLALRLFSDSPPATMGNPAGDNKRTTGGLGRQSSHVFPLPYPLSPSKSPYFRSGCRASRTLRTHNRLAMSGHHPKSSPTRVYGRIANSPPTRERICKHARVDSDSESVAGLAGIRLTDRIRCLCPEQELFTSRNRFFWRWI